MINALDQSFCFLVLAPRLQGDNALSASGHKIIAGQQFGEKFRPLKLDGLASRLKTETFQTSARQNESIPIAFNQLAQPRRNIAAHIRDAQIRTLRLQLIRSSHAAGRDQRARPQRNKIAWRLHNQNIFYWSAG